MKTLSRSNPARKAPKPKRRKTQVMEHTLTDAEVRAFFRTIKAARGDIAKRDYYLFKFIALQSPRVSTAAQITCGDVRAWLSTDEMSIRDEIAKAGRGYTAPLRAEAKRTLLTLQKLRAKRADGTLPNGDTDLFLWGYRGVRMSDRTIQQRMQKWARAAQINPGASVHWWRHTLAYDVRKHTQHRKPEAVVGAMLGQSSESVSRIYGQPSRQELIDAIPPASI